MAIPVPKPKYALGGDLTGAITNISNAFVLIVGSIALFFLILAAIRLITSKGNQETSQKAKMGIFYAIIGLILVILSYTIVSFAISTIS